MEKMELIYGMSVDIDVISKNIKRLINKIYKLLPMREEGKDWEKPLESIIEEFCGMSKIISGQDDLFFVILCKMKGLLELKDDKYMMLYRRIIFECLNLLSSLEINVCHK